MGDPSAADGPSTSARLGGPAALIGLGCAVALLALGHVVASAVAALWLAIRVSLGLAAPALALRFDRATRTVTHGVASVLGHLLLAGVWVVVVLPVWGVQRLTRFDPVPPWPSDSPSGRQRRAGLATVPYGAEPRSTMARRLHAVATVGVLALLVVGLAQVDLPVPAPSAPAATIIGHGFWAAGHVGEPFARALFDDTAQWRFIGPSPLTGVQTVPYRSRFITTAGMVRRSWEPPRADATVWFVGGSSLFGIGQRDQHTISSEVARLASGAGRPIKVVNLGVTSISAWQEALIVQLYGLRHRPPDVLVVYDGINDVVLRCRELTAGLPLDATGSLDQAGAASTRTCDTDPRAVSGRIAAAMSRDLDPLYRWAKRNGVTVLHAWQPTAATRRAVPSDPLLAAHLDLTVATLHANEELERAVRAEVQPQPVDLTTATDAVNDPVFFDLAHTNELGARLVARALWAHLAPLLPATTP